MRDLTARPISRTPSSDRTPLRIARSVRSDAGVNDMTELLDWFAALAKSTSTTVERVALDDLEGWHTDPITGDIAHHSGRFFSVEGLKVHVSTNPVRDWHQPIINQSEVGLLGILVKEFDGVLHCLMQAKVEPGNCNGLQLSPTVQATRSNYMRVHGGRAVPYLEYFQHAARQRVLADVRQSEQGSAFRHKRNRNIVVEVVEDVAVRNGFCWLTLGQVHRLLGIDDLVNMDTRTVLSCLPFTHPRIAAALDDGRSARRSEFHTALLRSCDPSEPSLHPMSEVLSWITEARTRTDVRTRQVPLRDLPGWHRTRDSISHDSGAFFDVIGVRVRTEGREVSRWHQPMIDPNGTGVVAFLVRPIGGVLHVLANTRVEAGYMDVVELAPTVQCSPDNYAHLPAAVRPRFLDEVLRARPAQIHYETVLSEEGGRFYHARNRYLVVASEAAVDPDDPDFRWLTVHQLVDLLRHSHYVNIQARSLVACLHSLITTVGTHDA